MDRLRERVGQVFLPEHVTFHEAGSTFHVREAQKGGKAEIEIRVPEDALVIQDLGAKAIPAFKKGTNPDGAFAVVRPGGLQLFVIECKKTLGRDELVKALTQAAWGLRRLLGLLSALASADLAERLGRPVVVFVPAFRTEAIAPEASPDVMSDMRLLGGSAEEQAELERAHPWLPYMRGQVAFEHVDLPIRLRRLQLDDKGFGVLELPAA